MTREAGHSPKASDDPLERLLDVALYGPVGLALAASERLPELAERGRREIEARVPAARFVGQMLFDQGSKEVKKRVDELPRRVKEVMAGLGILGASLDDDEPQSPPDDAPQAAPVPAVPASTAVEAVVPPVVVAVPDAESADLPIPGYDTLSASQVVQRLPGLSAAELDAIRSYEAARRGRKIVLLKVAQLRAAS